MKTIEKPFAGSIGTLAVLALFLLTFSCSPDPLTEPSKSALKPSGTTQETEDTNEVQYVLTEVAHGAALHGANGIDIGPDGNLYIASVVGEEIVVMNRSDGTIIKRFGLEMGVKGPDDLVFGPDGSLYWTDIIFGEVGRMTPEGVVTKQFVALGVNPITFSPDGRLFVGLDFLGDGLYELDPNLMDPPRPIIISTPENPYPLGFLNAFDFCADGFLYGPLFAANLVIKVDVGHAGDPVSTSPFTDGTVQIVASGFKNPASAKFDPKGVLHVLDQTGAVFQVSIKTGEKTLFTTIEPGLDNMVFDTDGTLFMTNNDEGWVAEILPGGQARIISPGGMISPSGVAVLAGPNDQDKVYVGDIYHLRQFNGQTGEQENTYKGYLVPEENTVSLIQPMSLSADGNNLVVASWYSAAVQVWDSQTHEVLEHYAMGAPIDAIRFGEGIIVSDVTFGGVVWASDQSMILPIDNATVFAPGGLATDGETVWVADWGSGVIWKIGFDGNTPLTPVVAASGLMNPEGLAFEKEGSLLVVESGASRLSRIDLSTGESTKIVDGLELGGPGQEGLPPTYLFDG